MRKTAGTAMIILLGLLIWLSSFWITRSRAIEQWHDDNPVWMQNVPETVTDQEQAFREQMQASAEKLKAEQEKFADLLRDSAGSDEAIRSQARVIAQAHADLLHGIAEHLADLRSDLPEAQKQLLSGFCRQTLGAPLQRRYRHGRQDSVSDVPHQPGRGFGRGFGQSHRRGRCGLIRKLQLTDEQLAVVEQQEPAFESDIRQLRSRLLEDRSKLQTLFESGENHNGQITRQVDAVINAHHALETRLIDFILSMRPYFSADQQQRLIGLCRRNCTGECPLPDEGL